MRLYARSAASPLPVGQFVGDLYIRQFCTELHLSYDVTARPLNHATDPGDALALVYASVGSMQGNRCTGSFEMMTAAPSLNFMRIMLVAAVTVLSTQAASGEPATDLECSKCVEKRDLARERRQSPESYQWSETWFSQLTRSSKNSGPS